MVDLKKNKTNFGSLLQGFNHSDSDNSIGVAHTLAIADTSDVSYSHYDNNTYTKCYKVVTTL